MSVELAGVDGDGDVTAAVAAALDAGDSPRTAPGRPAGSVPGSVPASASAAVIARALGPRPTLVVLDNCEHVIAGVAELVQALVSATRNLRVLTTSRAPLGLSSESVYPLPELDLATSAELFGQRARAARPGLGLPAAAVEGLCRRLDGLPLAVELAAARVRVMSVAEIHRRLDDRFALLRGAGRDAPRRHQALSAVVEWSWNLLEPWGQAAMRALSVFPGGFTAGVVSRFLAWSRAFAVAHHAGPFGAEPAPAISSIHADRDNLVRALRLGLERGDGAIAATTGVLAAVWTVESNYPRLAVLVEDTS